MHSPDNQGSRFVIYGALKRPSGLQYLIVLFILLGGYNPLETLSRIQFRDYFLLHKTAYKLLQQKRQKLKTAEFATSHYISQWYYCGKNINIIIIINIINLLM